MGADKKFQGCGRKIPRGADEKFQGVRTGFSTEFSTKFFFPRGCARPPWVDFRSALGNLPISLTNLTHLIYLNLSRNKFSGNLPVWLTNLYLDKNQLTGPIPSSYGSMVNLRGLGLSTNQLNGSIPKV
ncbi:putative non-specific serine/threonine protein kinase [Helianthus annuus]|nr:putative non-specific serine/threonine protein kinase [Helianthus annuus]